MVLPKYSPWLCLPLAYSQGVLPFLDGWGQRNIFCREERALVRGLEYLHFFSSSSSSRRRLTTSLGFNVSGLKFPPEITIRWIYTKADQNITTRPPFPMANIQKEGNIFLNLLLWHLDSLFLLIHLTGSSRLFVQQKEQWEVLLLGTANW